MWRFFVSACWRSRYWARSRGWRPTRARRPCRKPRSFFRTLRRACAMRRGPTPQATILFADLPPGPCRLGAQPKGFKPVEVGGITVAACGAVRQAVRFELAAVRSPSARRPPQWRRRRCRALICSRACGRFSNCPAICAVQLTTRAIPDWSPARWRSPCRAWRRWTMGLTGCRRGPGYVVFNAGHRKPILPARQNELQIGAASQNILKHVNYGQPDMTVNVSAGGTITSTHVFLPPGSPRQGQLNLRWRCRERKGAARRRAPRGAMFVS